MQELRFLKEKASEFREVRSTSPPEEFENRYKKFMGRDFEEI